MKPRLFARLVLLLSLLPASLGAAEFPILKLGSPLPDFSLPGVDGRTYAPKDFADAKLLAIIFTCDHCPTAQAYEERIKSLATDYKPRGVAIVAINPNSPAAVRFDELGYTDLDDTLDAMKIRATHKQFNFPYLDDGATESFSKQLGPVATPHVFIFDADRKLRYQGRIDNNEREDLVKTRDTRAALDALLASREPEVPETKVFGCSTKWDTKIESNTRWLEKVRKEPVTIDAATADILRDLRANKSDKVRLINVWATWCGPCVSEFDSLIETNLRFRHRDFELITIAAQYPDEKDKVLSFLQKHHASTRNYYFAETDKYKMFEALDPDWQGGLPHTLLIAPGGEILYRATEELDFLTLRRKIVPALNRITPWPGMSDAK
jgi:thiol-disulfide isomerase/thioredoxin